MIKESNDGSLFDFEEIDLTKPEVPADPKATKTSDDTKVIGILSDADEFEKNLKAEAGEDEDDDEDNKDDSEDLEKDKEDEEEKPEEKETKEKKKEKPKEEEEDEKEDKTSYSFKGIASYLSEEGIVDFEDSKDIEDSPELLLELVSTKIESGIKEYKESLPEVVEELVSYIEKGGDPSKFLSAINKDIELESLDLEDEHNQELIVKEYLKSQDYSKEEIDELITDYKEALVLEKQAKFASKRLEKIQETKKQALLQEQEEYLKEQQAKVEKYKSDVKNTIFSSSELAGLPVNKKEKEEFAKYILDVNPKTGLTKYQESLKENPLQTQVELAYLKFKNFDFGKLESKAKSEAAKDIRDKIFTKSETTPKGKTKMSEGEANFEAFKAMFGRK